MSKCIKCGNEILTGDIHWEMGLCNSCYNELYKDNKTHISLDKMWLELAQSFRDENEKLQNKIADLEAKLAESEKLKENYDILRCQHKRLGEFCDELNQQLAEKESELAIFKKRDIDNQKQLERQMNIHKHYLIKKDQDKISFALEKLEKVLNLVDGRTYVAQYIKDQIEELKKEMK